MFPGWIVESTLADTYWDVIGDVGFNLGWGRGEHFGDEKWSDKKFKTLKSIVKSGLRQFYFPPPDQAGVSHQWSFLKPFAEFTFASGATTLRLPFDCEGIEGQVLISTDSGFPTWLPLSGQVRHLYAVYPSTTGRPQRIEIEPIKGTGEDRGQRQQLVIWPAADQAYTIQFHYSIIPKMLDGDLPYAYGGPTHSETILYSCLAVSEDRIDDMAGGPRHQKFMQLLAGSISRDREKRPNNLGQNRDNSDALEAGYGRGYDRRLWGNWPLIRVNGQIPS